MTTLTSPTELGSTWLSSESMRAGPAAKVRVPSTTVASWVSRSPCTTGSKFVPPLRRMRRWGVARRLSTRPALARRSGSTESEATGATRSDSSKTSRTSVTGASCRRTVTSCRPLVATVSALKPSAAISAAATCSEKSATPEAAVVPRAHLRAGFVPEDDNRALNDGSGRVDHSNRPGPPKPPSRSTPESAILLLSPDFPFDLTCGQEPDCRRVPVARCGTEPHPYKGPVRTGPSGWGVDSVGNHGLGRRSRRRKVLPRQIRRQRAGLERHSRRQRQRRGEHGQIRRFGMPQGLRVIAAAAVSDAALRAGRGRAARPMTRHRRSLHPRFVVQRRLHRALPAAVSGRRVQAGARLPRRDTAHTACHGSTASDRNSAAGQKMQTVGHAVQSGPRSHRSRRALGQVEANSGFAAPRQPPSGVRLNHSLTHCRKQSSPDSDRISEAEQA